MKLIKKFPHAPMHLMRGHDGQMYLKLPELPPVGPLTEKQIEAFYVLCGAVKP